MAPRLDLHAILKAIPGVADAYFQPPSKTELVYPCITYQRTNADTTFADNKPYHYETRYMVTVMDKNPDSSIPKLVAALPLCVFDRSFTADGLNHDVFLIYF